MTWLIKSLRSIVRTVMDFFFSCLAYFLTFKQLRTIREKMVCQQSPFLFDGNLLPVFFHSYNNSGLTERAIEIPVIIHYLEHNKFKRVMEIGNVTKHYYEHFQSFVHKDTVDKYETAFDVLNEDIREFQASSRYDFIYSISTFEHMDSDGGSNPDQRTLTDSRFSSIAFENANYVIENLLAPAGIFLLSFPLGYASCEIDASLLAQEHLNFDVKSVRVFVYVRTGECKWKLCQEDTYEKSSALKSNYPINCLCIMEITK